jgi:acetyltransferase-like isoleucine patch superfamily enzyme
VITNAIYLAELTQQYRERFIIAVYLENEDTDYLFWEVSKMTEKEKSHAGMLYQPGDPELVADRDVTVKKLYDYNNLHPLDRDGRQVAIRELLGKTGDNCVVEQPLFCTYGYNTTVGDNFFLNVNCKLMDSGKITIGDNVFVAPNVCIITEEHAMDVDQRLAGLEYTHPVKIGDNVWICTGAIILPGVTIGANSVIGAGSVVTKDIPSNSLAVGNPCMVIRTL